MWWGDRCNGFHSKPKTQINKFSLLHVSAELDNIETNGTEIHSFCQQKIKSFIENKQNKWQLTM